MSSAQVNPAVEGPYDAARVESADAPPRPVGSGDLDIRVMDPPADDVISIPGRAP